MNHEEYIYYKYKEYKLKYLRLKNKFSGGEDEKNKCKNGCGMIKNGRYDTCCSACTTNGSHTNDCKGRNITTITNTNNVSKNCCTK